MFYGESVDGSGANSAVYLSATMGPATRFTMGAAVGDGGVVLPDVELPLLHTTTGQYLFKTEQRTSEGHQVSSFAPHSTRT